MILATTTLPLSNVVYGQQPSASTHAAANRIADLFSSVGDQIFEECVFVLSDEQTEVQRALISAYIAAGASHQLARRLAVQQIRPPAPSERCEKTRKIPPDGSSIVSKVPAIQSVPRPLPSSPAKLSRPMADETTAISLAGKQQPILWDCGPGVDYVTIRHAGYERKLTGGEICNPFRDIVQEVPEGVRNFRLGYTIRTGRLFVVSDIASVNGSTITWGLSGRDVCRNNPDPDCLASRSVGPLPPGEYSFASEKSQRVSWGPKTKRFVAAVYLSKLWNEDRFSPQHRSAILARNNIAIHVRLKGEMSEACIGLEPKGWAYVANLIRSERATGLNVYLDEPHPSIAEQSPLITTSTFSLSSIFK